MTYARVIAAWAGRLANFRKPRRAIRRLRMVNVVQLQRVRRAWELTMLGTLYGQKCDCSGDWEVSETERVSISEYEIQWKCTSCGEISLELRQILPVAKPLRVKPAL